MQKHRLKRKQKIFLASKGLKPENWYIAKETADYYQVVSKNGQKRILWKGEKQQQISESVNR